VADGHRPRGRPGVRQFIERIPIVNAATEVPGVGDLIENATGSINESINTAIYDQAIPAPEVESITTWRDAVELEVHEAVVTALYEDPPPARASSPRGRPNRRTRPSWPRSTPTGRSPSMSSGT
jgi:hypothetical protein